MPLEDARIYGADAGGANTSVGANTQINPVWFWKKALIEIVKEQYFGQLADVRSMPKHMGKTIKQHHYLPLLDDRNVSDQGIDAAGVVTQFNKWHVFSGGAMVADGTIAGNAAGFATEALAVAAITDAVNQSVSKGTGGLYGSSKDVGVITQRLPALSESGGRVNRVGFTRTTIEATLNKFGFFDEYTQESVDFDTDAELMQHISTESMRGASEITEDMLQIDLINNAGNTWFTGDATAIDEINTAGNATVTANLEDSILTYDDLVRVSIELDNNRCPKHTKLIAGSRMIDTKTVNAARYIYCGSVLLPTLKAMVDYHGNPAFQSVEKYASAGNVAFGEVGAVDNLRVIVVNEMVEFNDAGADISTIAGDEDLAVSGTMEAGPEGNANVYPLLVVGSGSFTTVGFQTDGKSMKFKITHKAPGREMADRNDPYGEIGFYSIKWYYAFMPLRPEWITTIYTGVASA